MTLDREITAQLRDIRLPGLSPDHECLTADDVGKRPAARHWFTAVGGYDQQFPGFCCIGAAEDRAQ